MDLGDITDEEVIGIMVDGGKKLCEYAVTQWATNKYQMDHATNLAHIARWRRIGTRIAELGRELKAERKQ